MPATALTVNVVVTAEPPYARVAHARVVADVQALEPHTSAAVSETVGDGLTAPKFSPRIVSEPPPLIAALADAVVATGAA